jgi:hypothetical protein
VTRAFRDAASGDTKCDPAAALVPPNLDSDLTIDHGGDLFERAAAVFDPHRRYRYLLTRTWSDRPPMTMCMLNPSTADAFTVDATITRCVRLARREQAGGLVVVNLFAFRATKPAELRTTADPVGPHTDAVLAYALARADTVIVAWGCHGGLRDRSRQVCEQLAATGARLRCLGTTQAGEPRHPLFTRADAALLPYPPH